MMKEHENASSSETFSKDETHTAAIDTEASPKNGAPVQTDSEKSEPSDSAAAQPETEKRSGEDSLELHSMKFKERMQAKRQKLKDNLSTMSKKEQISYILFYYKWTFIAVAIALICGISLFLTIYKNTRPSALSYAVLNISNPMELNTDFEDDYLAYYDFPKGYQIILDAQRHLNKESYLKVLNSGEDSADYSGFPALCFNGRFDVVITDEAGAEYCSMQEIFNPLQSYFPADIYPLLEDRIYEAANNEDIIMPFAIDISDTEFARSLNLDYDTVYLGFPGTTDQNYQHAKLFLKYILDLDIEVTVPED